MIAISPFCPSYSTRSTSKCRMRVCSRGLNESQAGSNAGAVALAARVPEAFDGQVVELLEEVGETLGLSLEESRSRQRLTRQRRFSQEILQRAGLIVVGLDPALRVSVFNRAAEEATGYRALYGHFHFLAWR